MRLEREHLVAFVGPLPPKQPIAQAIEFVGTRRFWRTDERGHVKSRSMRGQAERIDRDREVQNQVANNGRDVPTRYLSPLHGRPSVTHCATDG